MQVGHARVCLTPNTKFHLIGYRSENRYEPATGVHDDIYANALLFNDGVHNVFLFCGDVLEFEESMAEDVKTMLHQQFGIDRDMVLLCATHDHSSIVSYHKSWYTGKYDPTYASWLMEEIKHCYATCLENKQEAIVSYGSQIITGFYGNRNHPGELADNEVIVVKFENKRGEAFAGFVNWAVHSTLLGAENTELSGDLAGNVSKCLHEHFGFYPAMIVGAAGDCSNRNERQGNDFQELKRVSKGLADLIGTIPVSELKLSTISCQTLFHTIHHDMHFVHEEVNVEVAILRAQLEQAKEQQKKHLTQRIQELSQKLEVQKFHLDAKGSVISLGDLQFFVFPGELGSKFGIQMKQACEVKGIICGYTNGYYEYFMPQDAYGESFETIASPIPRGEAERMIQKYIQASKQLSK